MDGRLDGGVVGEGRARSWGADAAEAHLALAAGHHRLPSARFFNVALDTSDISAHGLNCTS